MGKKRIRQFSEKHKSPWATIFVFFNIIQDDQSQHFDVNVHGCAIAIVYKCRLIIHISTWNMRRDIYDLKYTIFDGINSPENEFCTINSHELKEGEPVFVPDDTKKKRTFHILLMRQTNQENCHFMFIYQPDIITGMPNIPKKAVDNPNTDVVEKKTQTKKPNRKQGSKLVKGHKPRPPKETKKKVGKETKEIKQKESKAAKKKSETPNKGMNTLYSSSKEEFKVESSSEEEYNSLDEEESNSKIGKKKNTLSSPTRRSPRSVGALTTTPPPKSATQIKSQKKKKKNSRKVFWRL